MSTLVTKFCLVYESNYHHGWNEQKHITPVEKFLWLQKSYESIQHQTLVLLWARNAAKSLWQKERARKKHHLLFGWTCIYERKINCLCHFETGHTFVLREKKINWSNVWAAKLTRNEAILLTSHLPFLPLLYCVNEALQLRQMMFCLFHGYACVWALVSEYICTHTCVCVFMNLSHNVYFDFVGERLPNCGAKPASGLTLVLLFIIICVIVIALSSSFSQVFYTSSLQHWGIGLVFVDVIFLLLCAIAAWPTESVFVLRSRCSMWQSIFICLHNSIKFQCAFVFLFFSKLSNQQECSRVMSISLFHHFINILMYAFALFIHIYFGLTFRWCWYYARVDLCACV